MTSRLTLTVDEAAELLGLSRGGAYAACAAGEIPTVRLGRRILVPRARLLALLGETSNSDEAEGGERIRRPAAPPQH